MSSVSGKILAVASFFVVTSKACDDICSCNQTILSCQCMTSDFVCVLKHLRKDVRHLNFTIKPQGAKTVTLETANLSQFHNLTELTIGAPYGQRENQVATLTGLDNPNTFARLSRLKTLRLNLPLQVLHSDLHPQVFAALPALVELDLSYTQRVNLTQLKQTFNGLSTTSLRVLRLRNVQGYANDPDFQMKLDLRDFLQPLERMPLEVLDISRNALLYVYPGILRQHHLKEIYFQDNSIRVTSFYTEVYFHPTLEISVGDYQGCAAEDGYVPKSYKDWIDPLDPIPQTTAVPGRELLDYISGRYRKRTSQFVQHKLQPQSVKGNDTSALIKLTNNRKSRLSWSYFICLVLKLPPQLWQWMEGIHCMDFPDIKSKVFVGEPCMFGVQIPFGPSFTELHLAHFSSYQGGFGTPMEGTYCFDPDNNNVKLIDFSGLAYWAHMFSENVNKILITGLVKLEVFVLTDSQFEIWKVDFLSHFPSLRVLNARGNRVHLENDTYAIFFINNTRLQEINLAQNELYYVPQKEFTHLTYLQILDLSKNSLQNVSFGLPTTGRLQLLKLNGNAIRTLSPQTRNQLDQIAARNNHTLHVDLSDNYLSCGCHDIDFIKWVKQTSVHFVKASTYQCVGDGQMLTFIDVKHLQSTCQHPYLVVVSASVLSTLAFVGIIVFAYTLHRQRYALAHAYYRRFVAPKVKADDTVYKYDAFIAYNSDDKWWAHHTLLAEMEEKRKRKLCIYLRDFPAGGDYVDVIESAMAQSRKTVLILSPKFFESNWCQHEMNMAHNTLVADGVDLVELVVLEPLPARVMTKTLMQLMQLKRHLTWTDNPDGQKLFWDQFEDLCKSPRRRPFAE